MTFLSTVLLDIDLGLVVGLCTSLLVLAARSCLPQLLQQEQDGGKTILQLIGPIHYLTEGGKITNDQLVKFYIYLTLLRIRLCQDVDKEMCQDNSIPR